MKGNILVWIVQEGYGWHSGKEGWYKRGSYRPWKPTVYLTHEQLIKLHENS